jgi:hypothetical protein
VSVGVPVLVAGFTPIVTTPSVVGGSYTRTGMFCGCEPFAAMLIAAGCAPFRTMRPTGANVKYPWNPFTIVSALLLVYVTVIVSVSAPQ